MLRRTVLLLLSLPLLLVIWFIVSILYGIFGPEDRGFWDFCGDVKVIEGEFQEFFYGKNSFPAYSFAELRASGRFSDILDKYWIKYTPFSSNTPNDKIVLRVSYGRPIIPAWADFSFTKADLMSDTDISWPGVRCWEEVLKENPNAGFVSERHAGHPDAPTILIQYKKQGDDVVHEEQLNYQRNAERTDWVLLSKQILR